MAVARNKELLEYRTNFDRATKRLESRKTIEKARGLLMEKKNMSEEEAYQYIRSISKKYNMAMNKIAEMLIKQFEV